MWPIAPTMLWTATLKVSDFELHSIPAAGVRADMLTLEETVIEITWKEPNKLLDFSHFSYHPPSLGGPDIATSRCRRRITALSLAWIARAISLRNVSSVNVKGSAYLVILEDGHLRHDLANR